MALKNILFKFINRLIPKDDNSMLVRPLGNCRKDKYDLINYQSDCAESLLNYWLRNPPRCGRCNIYLIVHFTERIPLYEEYVSKCNNLSFSFILSPECFNGIRSIIQKIKVLLISFKCKIWIEEAAYNIKPYAVIGQRQVILGYFASCKSNYMFSSASSAELRQFCTSDNVTVIATSHFDAMAKSAAFGVPMKCFRSYGLTRVDNFQADNNIAKVKKWIDSLKKTDKTRVILYAPTFRDYESNSDLEERSIWGQGYDDEEIRQFLMEKDAIVIAKLHAMQNEKVLSTASDKSIFLYQPNFDFSFYELMRFSDVLITDYSSIGYDWLFMDRPIIYNLWDLDVYRRERGLAYEPYEKVCGGEIVTNMRGLMSAISSSLENDIYADKRRRVKDLMFNVQDYSSNKSVADMIISYLN